MEEIGSGGFGKVVRCLRARDNEEFAKKILVVNDPASIKRFQREVRILQKLSHPRIIRIEAVHVESPPYWFVMPRYERTLRDIMRDLVGQRNRIASIFDGILEGMEYAHKQGIIHRDLKPENVLLDEADDPIISDFGLGRALEALTSRATGSHAWIGTQAYMAPEQTTSAARADERSDIFSLGRMLYELFTGDPPLAIPDLTKLPVGLAAVVRRCTKTIAGDRFPTIHEMRNSFNLVAVSRVDISGETDLRALAGEIAAQTTATPEQIKRLAQLISQCHEEPSLLHEIAVSLPTDVFSSLEKHDPAVFGILVSQFASVSAEQGWPFSYTDDLGTACRRIFEAARDPHIKGLVVKTALVVGATHNRYQVMAVAATMIARVAESDARAVAHALEDATEYFWAVRDRLEVRKLPSELRELFERTVQES